MPRKSKDGKPFNQAKYNNEWGKENLALVGSRYKKEFVEEFRAALKTLDLKQSDVIRKMMQETIDKAKQI